MCVHRMGTNECERVFAALDPLVGERRSYSYLVRA
jgi:hypothetical protein